MRRAFDPELVQRHCLDIRPQDDSRRIEAGPSKARSQTPPMLLAYVNIGPHEDELLRILQVDEFGQPVEE